MRYLPTIAILLFFSCKAFAQPTITTVNPLQAKVDALVTITGTNFSNTTTDNIVYFGAVKATVTSATSTQLTVKVPLGASYAPISVTTNALTATANMPFDVLFDAQGSLSAASFPVKIDSSTNTPYRILACDLDGDGKPEIVFGNFYHNKVVIYRNSSLNGVLNFESPTYLNSIYNCAKVFVADVDGDGKQDIITPNFDGESIYIYRNVSTIGNILLASPVKIDMIASTTPHFLRFDDLDGDGKLDMVATNYPLNGFAIFRNLSTVGNIQFDTRLDFATQGTYPTDIAIADLNNDGKKDIVIGNSQQYTVSVFRNVSNVGDIILSTPKNYAVTLGVHGIGIADLNNDGKLDIVTADYATPGATNYANTITILQNNTIQGASFGTSSFNTGIPITVGLGTSDIRFGDLNGDGKTDIVVGNQETNYISILENTSQNSNILLNSPINIITGNKSTFLDITDFNLDGKLDIVSGNYSSNTISILTNTIPMLANENLIAFTATKKEKNVLLKWQLSDVKDIDKLTLQHSSNAKDWTNIYITKSVNNANEYLHTNTSNSNNYYRLLQNSKIGKLWYSDIKSVNFGSKNQNVIYPNPTNNGLFSLQLHTQPANSLNYNIVSANGQVVKAGVISTQHTIINCNKLPKGNYFLQIDNMETLQISLK